MSTLSETIANLKNKFNADAAEDLDVIFQFALDEGDKYHITVKDQACDILEGAHDDPSVTLSLSTETLKGLLEGEVNGMTAFMNGEIRAEGDILLASRLGELFQL